MYSTLSPAERVLARSRPDGDCLLWEGSTSGRGAYGQISVAGGKPRLQYVHRVVYEATHGPIPDGWQVDHLCRRTLCVAPEHLEAVSPAENMRRRRGLYRKTHCPSGHAYEGDNVYRDGDGAQACRACRDAARRRWLAAGGDPNAARKRRRNTTPRVLS